MSGIKMPKLISSPSKTLLKRTAFGLIALVIIIFLAGLVLSHVAKNKIEQSLQRAGGKIRSVDINLFSQSVSLNDIELAPFSDTANYPTKARVKHVALNGISLYSILVRKHLKIDELVIEDGSILYNRNLKSVSAERGSSADNPSLRKITIDHITIRDIKIATVYDSVPEYSGTITLDLQNIQSSDTAAFTTIEAYSLGQIEASIEDVQIHDKNKLYNIQIAKVTASSQEKNLIIDSLLMIPQHSKFKFSRIVGKQTDRINAFIRNITIKDIQYPQLKDSAFVASSIDISGAEVYSFRDKRVPFRETKNKPLPMEAIKNLPVAVEIDSLRIIDSKITYEEFPEEGFKSGKVTFEHLEAKLINLSNRKYYNKPDFASLNASAQLMGKGLIEASFYLPQDIEKPYRAHGRISNMALYHLNPALENLAFISVESGRLNQIEFDFNYTDDISAGSLTINYENLKINGLKKEKGATVNDLKTLLINAFIKNDKGKSVPKDKRTGTISFERDKKRQIFNYWWKSLLSGIKGSVVSLADKKDK